MPWPIKTCPSRMRSLPSPRHCLKNFTTDNFNQGHRSFIPSTLPPGHACLVPPGRDATSSPWWRQFCAAPTVIGVSLHFFGGGVLISLAQFSKHRPKTVPLACCRHSFASGTWSCGPLQPSIPASCGSTPAKANLQSLLLEKLSLENLDWSSSFWNFYQRPVASTDCLLGQLRWPKESLLLQGLALETLLGLRRQHTRSTSWAESAIRIAGRQGRFLRFVAWLPWCE